MKIEDLLAVDDTDYTTVRLWGQDISLGSLSAADIYEYFDAVEAVKGTPERRLNGIKLVVKSLVDGTPETGTAHPARTGTPAHVDAFKKKNPKHIATLVEQTLLLNGLNKPEAKAEVKKGFGEAPLAASPIALQ